MKSSSQEESSLRKQLKGHFQFWPCRYLALRFWCLAKNLKMKVMGVETPVKEVVQKAVEENVSKTVVEHVTVHVKEHAIKGHGNII